MDSKPSSHKVLRLIRWQCVDFIRYHSFKQFNLFCSLRVAITSVEYTKQTFKVFANRRFSYLPMLERAREVGSVLTSVTCVNKSDNMMARLWQEDLR